MAEHVLTTGTTVTCPHGFPITFTSTGTLKVAGTLAIRATDLTAAVFGCTAQTKCATIKKSASATNLHDGGAAVVLVSGLETNIGPANVVGAETVLTAE